METEDRRNKIEERRQKGALKGSLKTSQMKKQEEDWGQRKKSDYLREKTEDRRKIAMKPKD